MATATAYPNADIQIDWTPVGGTLGYDILNDDPNDGDSTYLALVNGAGPSVAQVGTPAFGITQTAINKVTVSCASRYLSAAPSPYQHSLMIGGPNRGSSTQYTLAVGGMTTSYTILSADWLTNPKTGLAWTEADLERTGTNTNWYWGGGVRATAAVGTGYAVRVTNLNVTVDYDAPITTEIKSKSGLAYASIKSMNGLAIASVKNANGLA